MNDKFTMNKDSKIELEKNPSSNELRTTGLACLHLNLRRASRAMNKHFEHAMDGTGLTSQRFNIIMTLGANPNGMELMNLAELLVLDRSTLLRNLEPIEENGWIQDIPSDTKRARKIILTDSGYKMLRIGYPAWRKAQKEAVTILGDINFRPFVKGLRKLASQLDRLDNRN